MLKLRFCVALLFILCLSTLTASAESWATVERGNLSKTVYGYGAIQPASQPGVYAALEAEIAEYCVALGDEVKKGDILVHLTSRALDAKQQELEYDLAQAQLEVQKTKDYSQVEYRILYDDDGTPREDVENGGLLKGKYSNELSIRSPAAGRIKAIYIEEGSDALAVYREKGAVMLLSLDGKMKVRLSGIADAAVALGDTVIVRGEGVDAQGTIVELARRGTEATVEIRGDAYPMDLPVTVWTEAEEWLGEGVLEINKPLSVSAYGGTIRAIKVKEGQIVNREDVLARFVWEEMPLYIDNQSILISWAKSQMEMESIMRKRNALVLTAPCDGRVASLDGKVGDSVSAGSKLLSIVETEAGMRLTLSVDELDVVSVEPGQRVTVEVDALEDVLIHGTVEKIAPLGDTSSAVTKYDVFVRVDEVDLRVLGGMNVSGEIIVAEKENTLIVPTEALAKTNGVWTLTLSDGSVQQVELGVMTRDRTEILSGVYEGEIVVY